jgi:predicted metal-binding protein
MKPIRRIPIRATRLIAICGKCGRKLDGGFGPGERQPLAKALKRALNLPKPKHAGVRLVETRCLKLCPKGAVVVADSDAPGSLLVIPAGAPIAEVANALQLAATGEPAIVGKSNAAPLQRSRVAQAIASTIAETPSGTSAQAEPATSSGAAAASPPDSTYSEMARSNELR